MKCLKCKKVGAVTVKDELCQKCHSELESLLEYYRKLWMAGEIFVGDDDLMDRTGEPF